MARTLLLITKTGEQEFKEFEVFDRTQEILVFRNPLNGNTEMKPYHIVGSTVIVEA